MGVLSELRIDSAKIVRPRVSGKDRAILFLHGFNGDPIRSWEKFPELLEDDEALQSWDVVSLGFPMSSYFKAQSFTVLSQRFYSLLKDPSFAGYKQLAIIAHGEGGLIAQRALLDHEDLAERVSHLFLFAVPTAGLRLPFLPLIGFLFDLPLPVFGLVGFDFLLKLFRPFFSFLFDLQTGSPFLRDLVEKWNQRFGQAAPFEYWSIAAERDRIVPFNSLLTLAEGHHAVVQGDHSSLIKPEGDRVESVEIVRNALKGRALPERTQQPAQAVALLEPKVKLDYFDVFLYHSRPDRAAVRIISSGLSQCGLNPWVKEEQVDEGEEWDKRLLESIDKIGTVAVFIGKSQPPKREQDAIVGKFRDQGHRVLPVFLPGCAAEPDLSDAIPKVLEVDLCEQQPNALGRLVRAITGKEPELLPASGGDLPELYKTLPAEGRTEHMNDNQGEKPPHPNNDADPDNPPPSGPGKAQAAGIVGAALTGILTLFQGLLQQKLIPKLGPDRAFQLIMAVFVMVFAIAIIGMIKSGSSKALLILLFGGGVICSVFVFANRPLGGDQSHRLRVTVLDPNHVPVNRAHVWSTLGGEVKQVDGGWEIELPSMPGSAKRQATIRAEVADSAWRGETQVEFGNDFVPPVTVQLESSGEARIRGVVVDENDDAVPRAFVTVSGFETMSTDANGSFNLSAHVAAGKDVQLRAEKPGYTSITRTLQAGDTPVSIVLKHKGAKQPPSAPAIQKTGDAVIDRVIANLAELQRLDRAPAESRLAEVLAPLFNRPAFYGMTEGDWRFFLYPLCRTRLMLEQHVGSFKSHPEVREKITLAIQTMVEVQNSVAKLYGPNFSISQHISRYINTQKDFTDNLPPIVESPTVQFIQDRDQQIRRIRELLRSAGFPIK